MVELAVEINIHLICIYIMFTLKELIQPEQNPQKYKQVNNSIIQLTHQKVISQLL